MREILATPELHKLIETIGAESGAGTPEEWGAFYTTAIAKWAALMKQLNIRIEWCIAIPATVGKRLHFGHSNKVMRPPKADILQAKSNSNFFGNRSFTFQALNSSRLRGYQEDVMGRARFGPRI